MYGIELPVQIVTRHIVRPRLDVYYSTVENLRDPQVQQNINNSILNLVNKMIVDQEYYVNPRTEITGSYEIKLNEKGILSLSLIHDSYSGGVHGLRLIKSLNFDVGTGREYKLRDLFKPDADYIKRLSDIIMKQIKERNIYLLGEFKGIRPDADFYLTDKDLVIYFQLYEITSYAFGFPYFPISVYDIKDIINDQGPLKKLLY